MSIPATHSSITLTIKLSEHLEKETSPVKVKIPYCGSTYMVSLERGAIPNWCLEAVGLGFSSVITGIALGDLIFQTDNNTTKVYQLNETGAEVLLLMFPARGGVVNYGRIHNTF